MLTLPAEAPVTTPLLFTVATDVLPLLHTPPPVVEDSDAVVPTQTVTAPAGVIAEGNGLTKSVVPVVHVPMLYVMVVVPPATPVATPPELMVAMAVLLLAHAPPVTASDRPIVDPTQTCGEDGTMAEGVVLTVTGFVTEQPKVFV